MKVLLYGCLTDTIGRQVELETSRRSIADVRRRLAELYPEAAESLSRSKGVLDGAIVSDDHDVDSDGQLEFLPPVSGG